MADHDRARPGLKPGLPLAQAESQSQEIHAAIECLLNCPPEVISQWNGFQRRDFYVNGRTATLVAPKIALPGNPWIWRPEFFDAPVCDFKSWPGGKGKGKGSPADWAACLKVYGLSEEEALSYPLNPVDNLKKIAEAKIPIIAVAGDADDVVPMEENINPVEKRYRELGGEIQVIVKPGVGHHPHSLDNPTPVVNFLLKKALKPAAPR